MQIQAASLMSESQKKIKRQSEHLETMNYLFITVAPSGQPHLNIVMFVCTSVMIHCHNDLHVLVSDGTTVPGIILPNQSHIIADNVTNSFLAENDM